MSHRSSKLPDSTIIWSMLRRAVCHLKMTPAVTLEAVLEAFAVLQSLLGFFREPESSTQSLEGPKLAREP